ncbi:M16 family metallopeptidase [Campylobacter insulaenigrae]|uniref:M16 family metallopeptidase n=1 Tax=Campylobacter insulaenigrae TaxID=260714 RepID=UPI000F6EB193|nr:pitrilysin family protein [Campylobacter insulaenigrae]MCR6570229.1 insulinase family protein [Campylobacter insulaenigrae]MCR6573272.1 insulinase family protein [Campylobacter insulaenigrae]MCR6576259.1 insulinase family protein [Campylobacter insulaenigrae]MCR6580674.1 insulinase family protein [Campylobacter insulaenigrae]MCR6587151.1 insulinase family protein [Campylobacter insulaenigrae]
MIEYKKITLDNQLDIYTFPINKKSGVISVDIFYKVGSRNEKMGKSGIAHMLEHLNFKSTKNLKAGEFDEIVKGFGGIDNASTGFDYTHYFIKCSNENLDKSLWLFAELMQNLNLNDKEFQPERDVVLEERRWRTDNNPLGYLYFNLYNHAFSYHPYHWTPIGFFEDIENWTINDIKDFHQKFYQPKNAILIVSGDIDEDEVFKLAKKHFNHIKNTKDIPQIHEKEPIQNGAKRVILHKDNDTQLLALAYKIPPFNHEDIPKLYALSDFLGSGKSSLISEILVDKLGLINEFYAYINDSIDENLFIFICICNENIDAIEVEKELLNIINDIKDAKFDDEILEKIKNNVKSDIIFALNNATSVANIYGSYLAKGDLKPLLKYEENINALNKQDLVDCAKKYFNANTSTTIILKKDEK